MVKTKGLESLEKLRQELLEISDYLDRKDVNYLGPMYRIKEELEVLAVIYNSPFIIDNLVELGKLPPEAKKRYLFGTITNAEVEKVEEFFKNGEK